MKGNLEGRSFRPLLSKEKIEERISDLAKQISKDYEGKELVCVGVLNGAYMFFADLTRKLDIDIYIDFIRISSYSNNKSSGTVNIQIDLKNDIKGKHVLLIEDIIDTGFSFYKSDIVNKILDKGALSCKIAAFASKPSKMIYPIKIDYLGFEFPDKYVVGYGFDSNEIGRNLEEIVYLD